jgi:sugar/nucleoside kinase (ribokinase family)
MSALPVSLVQQGAPVLAVLGDLLEDVVVWNAGSIRRGTDSPATIHRTRGGSAANVAAAASSEVAVRFIGRVGSDPLGDQLEAAMRALGIDVRLQRGGKTGTVVVLVDATGERDMIPDRGAAGELEPIEVRWLDGVSWLHVPLYAFATEATARAATDFIAEAHARAIPVSIDASSVSLLEALGLEQSRALVDQLAPTLVFANADEAAVLGLLDSPPPAGRTVVVKRGADSVRVLVDVGADGLAEPVGTATAVDFPVVPVAAVLDSTGAGDCFAAAFLAAQLRAEPLETAVLRASRAAGRSLAHPGSVSSPQ